MTDEIVKGILRYVRARRVRIASEPTVPAADPPGIPSSAGRGAEAAALGAADGAFHVELEGTMKSKPGFYAPAGHAPAGVDPAIVSDIVDLANRLARGYNEIVEAGAQPTVLLNAWFSVYLNAMMIVHTPAEIAAILRAAADGLAAAIEQGEAMRAMDRGATHGGGSA